MKLKLTQKGLDFFDNIRSIANSPKAHDFSFTYIDKNCPSHTAAREVIGVDEKGEDIYKGYPESFKCCPNDVVCDICYHYHYNCNLGEEMEVDDDHYENSDLKTFVEMELFERII